MTYMRRSIDTKKVSSGTGQTFWGKEGIIVELIDHTLNPLQTIYRMIEATEDFIPQTLGGLTPVEIQMYMEDAVRENLKGGLQLPLEAVSYTFAIGNISRTCTHQLVRTRVGAGFSQQSLRWRNVENFNFRMPVSITDNPVLEDMVDKYIQMAREIHRELVLEDIPYQDARFVIPMGMTTHLIATYNYLSLKNFCATRLCNMVQWEINEVARLMKEEVVKVEPILGSALIPRCEMINKCTFAGWESKCEEREFERDWTSQRKGMEKNWA